MDSSGMNFSQLLFLIFATFGHAFDDLRSHAYTSSALHGRLDQLSAATIGAVPQYSLEERA
jgi:hypothetical protein